MKRPHFSHTHFTHTHTMEELEAHPCPEHLDRYGKKLWKRCIANLQSLGKLHDADYDLIEQYVFSASECRRLSERISDEGSTIDIPYKNGTMTIESPAVKAYVKFAARVKSLADVFGFNPKGRKELGTSEPAKKEDKFNDL